MPEALTLRLLPLHTKRLQNYNKHLFFANKFRNTNHFYFSDSTRRFKPERRFKNEVQKQSV